MATGGVGFDKVCANRRCRCHRFAVVNLLQVVGYSFSAPGSPGSGEAVLRSGSGWSRRCFLK
jgi:hypothetical protein